MLLFLKIAKISIISLSLLFPPQLTYLLKLLSHSWLTVSAIKFTPFMTLSPGRKHGILTLDQTMSTTNSYWVSTNEEGMLSWFQASILVGHAFESKPTKLTRNSLSANLNPPIEAPQSHNTEAIVKLSQTPHCQTLKQNPLWHNPSPEIGIFLSLFAFLALRCLVFILLLCSSRMGKSRKTKRIVSPHTNIDKAQ